MSTNGNSPVFNTTQGTNKDVVVVAMNEAMADMLASFIEEIAYPEYVCPKCVGSISGVKMVRGRKPDPDHPLVVEYQCPQCRHLEEFTEVERQIMAFKSSLRRPGGKVPPKQDMYDSDGGYFVRMQGISGCEILILQPDDVELGDPGTYVRLPISNDGQYMTIVQPD